MDMGNMMNPSRWMGGNNNDRYDDYRGGPVYGYGGAPAYSEPGSESNEAEIKRLKERLRQLESGPRQVYSALTTASSEPSLYAGE